MKKTKAVRLWPSITIGITVYNGGAYLTQAIRSIQKQSFQNWDLILVDDGSTDKAVKKLSPRIRSDPRIKVFRFAQRRGIACRLNQIVRKARGQYFARMDADDVCHRQRLKKQLSFLIRNPDVDLAGTSCLAMDDAGRITGKLNYPARHSQICGRPWDGFLSAHPSWMGKTVWFRQNPYLEPAPFRCEDQELLLRAHRCAKFANLTGHYLAYRMPKQMSFGRLLRTRLAWWKVQTSFFIKKREIVNLLLCFFSCALKIFLDPWRLLGVLPKRNRQWHSPRGTKKHRILSW